MKILDKGAKQVETSPDPDRTRTAEKAIANDNDPLPPRHPPHRAATVKTVEEIDQNVAVRILLRVNPLASDERTSEMCASNT
jgi:hypothetical protein